MTPRTEADWAALLEALQEDKRLQLAALRRRQKHLPENDPMHRLKFWLPPAPKPNRRRKRP